MLFLGLYNHSIDAKNRIFIPSRYRESLEGGFVVCKAPEKCVFLYTQEEFENVSADIRALPGNPKNRQFARNFFSNAYNAELDKQGRFTLKSELIEYAGLKENIVIVGAGNKFEIWDADAYNRDAEDFMSSDESDIEVRF